MQLPLRGRLFEQRSHEKRPLAVGDRVAVELTGEGGAIHSRLPRTTRLARKAAAGDEREQVLAANVSLVLVVMAVREPQFQPDLVDRIFAGALREDISGVLVMTKMDRDRKGSAARYADLYRSIGYEVVQTSITPEPGNAPPKKKRPNKKGRGEELSDNPPESADPERKDPAFDRLKELLASNVTVLTGPSGAGKSTLLNHLAPGFALKVGSLSKIRQGRHTTTHTRLLKLPFSDGDGGYVLDTPGIRSFGLYGVGSQELSFWFQEFRDVHQGCPFRDCTHTVEPDCAVRAAVASGAIAESRYDSYLALLEDAKRLEKAESEGD